MGDFHHTRVVKVFKMHILVKGLVTMVEILIRGWLEVVVVAPVAPVAPVCMTTEPATEEMVVSVKTIHQLLQQPMVTMAGLHLVRRWCDGK